MKPKSEKYSEWFNILIGFIHSGGFKKIKTYSAAFDTLERRMALGDIEPDSAESVALDNAKEDIYYGKVLNNDTRAVVARLDEDLDLTIFDIQRLFLINLVQRTGVKKMSWVHIVLAVFGALMAALVVFFLGAMITDVLTQEMASLKVQIQVIVIMLALVGLPNVYLTYISTAGPLGYRQYKRKCRYYGESLS